jgi:hypothetical protein
MIYTQKSAWQCWNYAFLNALQKMWVNILEKEILDLSPWGADTFFWYDKAERLLIAKWLIKSLSYIISPRRIDTYLAKGEKLVALIYKNNFNSVRNTPYIQDFKWKYNHFVCVVEDCGDRWKVVDQQGENFAEKWYWYILKSNIWNVRIAKINL